MALDLVVEDKSNQKVLIFTDNQAALNSFEKPKQQSGQYLLQQIALRIESFSRQLEIHWIPAHFRVPGNKSADIAAKEAIRWKATGPPSTPAQMPHNLSILTSEYKTATRYRANEQLAENWKTEKHGRTTFKLTPEPSTSVLHKFNAVSRAESSVIVQARTGKIRPRSYFYSIDAEDSRNWPCGREALSVQHILLCCPDFEELKENMWETRRETDLKALLGSSESAKREAQFLINTRLLPQIFHANLSSTEEDVSDVDSEETEAEDIW